MLSRLSDGIAEVKKHFYKFRCALHKNLHRKSDSKTGGVKMGYGQYFGLFLAGIAVCLVIIAIFLLRKNLKRHQEKQEDTFVVEYEIMCVHTEETINSD